MGPGVIRLGWTNPIRAERVSERAVNRHRLVNKDGRPVKNSRGALPAWLRPAAIVGMVDDAVITRFVPSALELHGAALGRRTTVAHAHQRDSSSPRFIHGTLG